MLRLPLPERLAHEEMMTMLRARSARAGLVLLACGLGAMTMLVSVPSAHAAQATDVVSASVAPGSRTDPRGSYYVIESNPGTTVQQSVVVVNPNDRSMLVDLGGVDAATGASTGATYGSPGSKTVNTGAWVHVDRRQIQLSAAERRVVPFRVEIPAGTPPGQYLAGLSIAVPRSTPRDKPNPGANQAGFSVSLQAQRVIAVEVDVPGPRAPELVVRGAKPLAHGDMIDLSVKIANVGNAFARGRGVVKVADTNLRHEFEVSTFVSKTSIEMAVPWTRNAIAGDHAVEVVLTYDDGRRATWNGVVHIDEALRARLDGELRVATPTASSSGMPLGSIAIAGGVIGVALCSALAMRLRRRRPVNEFLLENGVRIRD